jgi:hypothetical protein
LGAQFDELPPADAFPGDLTADVPPAPGGLPFELADLLDSPENIGLDVPPARFTGGPDELPFDQGLDFALDPDMAAAPIVRGGGDPRTVQDTLLSDELMTRPGENLGRPLDADTADRLAPLDEEMVTRPDPRLGDEFGTDFGAPPQDPLLRGPEPPLEGEWIPGAPRPRGPRNPNAGAEDFYPVDQLPAPDALFDELFPALEGPQKRLPAPERDLVDELTLEDAPTPPAPKARDLTDDVMDAISSSGPKATQTIPGLEMSVTDLGNGRVRLHAGSSRKGTGRLIELEVGDDALTLRAHRNGDNVKGQGLGQQNYVQAAKYAEMQGKRLDGDRSLSASTWRSFKAAVDKGLIEADDIPYAAIDAAMERGGGVATNPSGKSWVTGIRPGPLS